MYKTLKKLFIFTLICIFFPFSACATAGPSQPQTTPQTPPNPPQKQEPQSQNPPVKNPDGIWDVTDVDVSEILKDRKLISFTFDDAPKRSLEGILAVFAAFNEQNPHFRASATLFCNGILIDESTLPLLQTAWTMQFELGNHTHTHLDLTTLPANDLRREINQTDKLLSQTDNKPLHLLRAPYGKLNECVRAAAQTPIIDWTIDTNDWTGRSADAIYDTVMQNKTDGSIVLMHDGYPHTISALKRLLPDLMHAGYQVVSVSKMAKAHQCNLQNGSVYIRARKR